MGAHTLQRQEDARESEGPLARQDTLDHVEPLLRERVALLMIALVHAEHLKFALIPANHQIEAEASCADVIGGHELFGGNHRMEQRSVYGAEYGDARRGREQARCPSYGLKGCPVKIRGTAITFPARNGQHEVDATVVRHPG